MADSSALRVGRGPLDDGCEYVVDGEGVGRDIGRLIIRRRQLRHLGDFV